MFIPIILEDLLNVQIKGVHGLPKQKIQHNDSKFNVHRVKENSVPSVINNTIIEPHVNSYLKLLNSVIYGVKQV
jgi:hypothetical protein